ncbi:hypothetical protein VI08_13570 [Luteibacter yeojuensis]|uniref:Uncharacterized protein n=2 Tax=Luteibacter yeojuensis TaxID=345309 RepID=A0A0F3KME6_9GAMM|nr:hypothetical protein VI08_13570 [Luteibacter yeojuensis]
MVSKVLGKVIWFHDELKMALIERRGGFTVGSVDEGFLTLGGYVEGALDHQGPTVLMDLATEAEVSFLVEADTVTEDEANELLGIVRSESLDK